LGAFSALSPASPAWALGTFTRHLTITVGAGVVVAGPHPNFPLLVDVSNGELRTTANGSQVQSANGYDIVFRGEDTGICGGPATCMLDHEIELYDGGAAGGRVVAWVRASTGGPPHVLQRQDHLVDGGDWCSSTPVTSASGTWGDRGRR
jgi:hypothetical protein